MGTRKISEFFREFPNFSVVNCQIRKSYGIIRLQGSHHAGTPL